MCHFFIRKIHPSFIITLFTIGVVLGVALSFATNLRIFLSPIWLLVVAALILANFIKPIRILFALSLIAGIITGSFRVGLDLTDRAYISQFIGQSITVSGRVYEDPDASEGKISIRLNNLNFGGQHQSSGTLFVQLSTSATYDIQRSDILELSGKLTAGFGSFAAGMFRPQVTQITRPDPGDIALQARNGFASQIKNFIKTPEVDLSLSYLLGTRRALPPDITETFKVIGLTHIIVVSGFHLSVLVRASRRIFSKISRFGALFFGILLILAFIAITGLSPSMVRAGLVSILSLLTWYFGRKFHPAKLLFLVAASTLLFNPAYIIDLGWLLSFASFSGIMLASPILTKFFYGSKKANFASQLILETISAQLCCIPILLYFFGSFSILSVIANVLVLPTIPFVMATTFATGLAAIIPFLAHIFGQLSTWILSYQLMVINFFGSLREFLVTIPPANTLTLFIYLPILAFLIYAQKSTKTSLRPVNIIE